MELYTPFISILEISYILASALFILGLKKLSHPDTARNGNLWAAAGMTLAILCTILFHKKEGEPIGNIPWILAALVGLPILMLLVSIPTLFLSGLMQVYISSVWTLTYRDLRAMEALSAGAVEGEVEEVEAEPTETE